jgi:hypothetical protein
LICHSTVRDSRFIRRARQEHVLLPELPQGVFFEALLKSYCVKPLKCRLSLNTVDNDYIVRLKRIHKRRRSASGISQRLSPIIAATVIHHLDV